MDSNEDDIIFAIYINEEKNEYTLIVSSQSGDEIAPHRFILELEAWLHEISQAEINRNEPGTSLH